ncbi:MULTISPECIES: DUF885 family protein [Amycolatopsis]|uniref:DUF885 family protein n=1 Tax=Amycolatopsis dendrobii TaxID=2760662 RepID=A0A7W3W5F7_9PSEU|nr:MULTISPECIES: DUF885 family protein [Amycolatopsis]MBB1159203.1 DUF885 family protein [Amycolatopsis dendrobii]UKD58306.1 DUF885 domain-containing protein [Amycolatopsis sp. FU40]
MTEAAHALAELAAEFRGWRTQTQPDSGDDVPRVDRPAGWLADWSASAVAKRRLALADYTERHQAVDVSGEPVSVQVDGRLLGSALARVHWELDLLRGWQRNPGFYVEQALLQIFNLLLMPPPFDRQRVADLVRNLRHVPVVLGQGRENLPGHAAAPFAEQTLRGLATAAADVELAMAELAAFLAAAGDSLPETAELPAAAGEAARALDAYRDWLGSQSFDGDAVVGPEGMRYFLHNVALLPYSAGQLRDLAREEFNRAVAAEAILRKRVPHGERLPPRTLDEIVEQLRADESAVRAFYADRDLLRLPDDLRRYTFAAMPSYLAPLSWLGVTHDIGSLERPAQDAVCYMNPPRDGMSYFAQAKSRDPRIGLTHEAVHAFQSALSWRHPNPVRRHFHDSIPNEGIAFYNEELLLQAGLLDDMPDSAVFIANSMRLRALRVEVDIRLAEGTLTIDEAADQLADIVPMDRPTAWQEAAFFAGTPGQGLSYLAGKAQILSLLAACAHRSDRFDLRSFHERLWLEGNVPAALLRWELLGLDDHLGAADRLAG